MTLKKISFLTEKQRPMNMPQIKRSLIKRVSLKIRKKSLKDFQLDAILDICSHDRHLLQKIFHIASHSHHDKKNTLHLKNQLLQ